MNKYRILEFSSRTTLVQEVNNLMNEGFIPLGGVDVHVTSGGSCHYCQAMLLTEIGTEKTKVAI